MNIFKIAFKVSRDSKAIYKGFGFKHLSDATQYYVHPNNQSASKTTTLCQPIGEAIIMFSSIISAIMNPFEDSENQKPFGDYFIDKKSQTYQVEFSIPEDWTSYNVVEKQIASYRAKLTGSTIIICAYDNNGEKIQGNMDHFSVLYKLLPAFCVLLSRENETVLSFRQTMEKFCSDPNPETFVNLCEDFYQLHKFDDYDLKYNDVLPIFLDGTEKKGWRSFSKNYQVILDNKKALILPTKIKIQKFEKDDFTEKQRAFIPQLSSEFVLPKKLEAICSAITCGDIKAILLHGPAGTGKTMGCRLMAQEIALPIMETINCTENLDEFVLGKFIPQDNKIIFKESEVTSAIRDGGAVVFEEINFSKPQYLAFLNSLLDDNGFVRLDNGDVVKRHKNFRFFATMNIGYYGTKELNQALYNRFNAIVEIATLSDEAIERMLIARVPECKPFVKKLLGVYHKIQTKIEAEELDVVISPRNLENWARLAKYEGYMTAAEKTIVSIAKCDREIEQAIRKITMLYKWS